MKRGNKWKSVLHHLVFKNVISMNVSVTVFECWSESASTGFEDTILWCSNDFNPVFRQYFIKSLVLKV